MVSPTLTENQNEKQCYSNTDLTSAPKRFGKKQPIGARFALHVLPYDKKIQISGLGLHPKDSRPMKESVGETLLLLCRLLSKPPDVVGSWVFPSLGTRKGWRSVPVGPDHLPVRI